MKVILTGVSSFTGCWFANELSSQGFEVICPLPRKIKDYTGIKKTRLDFVRTKVSILFNCPLGSTDFLELCSKPFDFLGFHASYVKNYHKNDFKISKAFEENLKNIELTLSVIKKHCRGIIYSSSIFENAINLETEDLSQYSLPWFNYAFAKKITYLSLKSLSEQNNISFKRFVITNPFGPYEDKKISYYIMKSIIEMKEISLRTPLYKRDMIHVQVLAKVYAMAFFELQNKNCSEVRPSQYNVPIQEFAKIMLTEMSRYTKTKTLNIGKQKEFFEPKELLNDQKVSDSCPNLDYEIIWSEYYKYYKESTSL